MPKLTVDQIEERHVSMSQSIHPSGVDSAVCYPLMVAAKDSMLLAWSKYTINQFKHEGGIRFARIEHCAD